ncbi:YcjF family protein [Candidatus Dependentiae bacterium]|nr:YcjF family protein [Candidatus Dependentiae bacterium]
MEKESNFKTNPSEKNFSKEDHAKKLVKNYMWWSIGAGIIPIPFVDMMSVTGVQMKLLYEMSKIYNIPFKENAVKSILSTLLGSIVPNSLSYGSVGSIIKSIPLIGTVLGAISMSIFSGAATYAIGKVFIQHFESDGTFLDFEPNKVKEYFKEQFKEGQKISEEMNNNKDSL